MKKKALIAMLLACTFAFGTVSMTACNIFGGDQSETEQGEGTPVAVTGVSLNKHVLNLKKDESETLTATVAPADADTKTVTWSTSDPSVASVDVNGRVTAHAVGTATITVTTTSGSKTDSCTVNVSEDPPAPVKVTSVSLDITSKTLTAGESVTLTPSVSPSDADNKNVSWSSSNTTVASVVGGVVTANKAGTATITVTTEDGSKTATCAITVQAAITTTAVTGVSVNPTSKTLKVGETTQLTKTITPADASNQNVTWQSGNTAVATVDSNGLVTAQAAGTATITVKTADGNFTATCTVTVEKKADQSEVSAKISYTYAGNECAAFEWGDTNPANATVEYKLHSASSYTPLSGNDKKFLVRQINATTARVDFVGLKGGAAYDFKITPSSGGDALTATNVTIHSYDRSGYAHFNYTSGVGAYKDDGTVKSNAKVYYVTENNKNNIDGNGTSLAELLENSSNGTANSLKNSAPIVIRVIGTVKCPQYLSANNLDNSIPDIDGITRTDMGNDSYWNMIDIKEGSNITVEGIGEDATIFQFGFTWKKCSSIEVRNLTFTDYPEDACSFEGDTGSPSSYKYIWLHHSVFNIGKNGWDKTDEQDKHDGDGATDLKGVSNVTFSYLQYNACHKTGLVGGGDTHLTSNVTFHHNYYNGNQQRLPLGRQANMHMYNNYYYKSTMYSISLRANAYAFIENNYFDNSNGKGTIEIRNSDKVVNYGYGKLFNNKFANENKKGFQKYENNTMKEFDGGDYIVEVSSRTQKVANTNSFNQNFDTDSSAFYYDATNQKSNVTQMLTADETKTYVPQLAGVQKRGGDVTLGGAGGANGTGGGTGTEIPEPVPTPSGTLTDSATVVGAKTANTVLLEVKNGGSTVAKVTLLVGGGEKSGGTLEESNGSTQTAEGHIQLDNTGSLKLELAEGYTYTVTVYAGSSSNTATRDITINDVTKTSGIGSVCKALTWNLTAGTYTSTETGKIRIAKIVIVATPV